MGTILKLAALVVLLPLVLALALGLTLSGLISGYGALLQHGVGQRDLDAWEERAAYTQTEVVRRTLYTVEAASLVLVNRLGNVEVTGWPGATLYLKATKRVRPGEAEALDRLAVEVQTGSGRIAIRSWGPAREGLVDYVLRVPRGLRLTIEVGVGEVRVRDFEAPALKVRLGAGTLELHRVAASEVAVDVGLGEVDLEALRGEAVRAELAMGALKVGLPPDCSCRVRAAVDMGDLTFKGLHPQGGPFRRRVSAVLGKGEKELVLHVGWGELAVRSWPAEPGPQRGPSK